MKSALSVCLIFVSFFVLASPAQAFFEARVTYGFLKSDVDLGDLCSNCIASAPSIVPTYGLGADAIFTLPIPLIPGFGIRYENMGLSVSSGASDYEANFTRTAILVNCRIIDTLIYVGPILSYGISHSGTFKVSEGGTEKSHFSPGSTTSYSAGLEAGVKLIGFAVGAELGYMNFNWKDSVDSTGNNSTQDINMSGPYGKLVLGFSI
ncbi:MAG: hypothetical protein J7501_06695 [Bdellovibrio sp.]|nr:hypothetical protein [Bdellovibrio sp.]